MEICLALVYHIGEDLNVLLNKTESLDFDGRLIAGEVTRFYFGYIDYVCLFLSRHTCFKRFPFPVS